MFPAFSCNWFLHLCLVIILMIPTATVVTSIGPARPETVPTETGTIPTDEHKMPTTATNAGNYIHNYSHV